MQRSTLNTQRSSLNGKTGEALLLPEDDAAAGQVVGGKLDLDLVAGKDADEMLAHFAGDVAENLAGLAALIEAQLEHGVWQGGSNGRFHFNRL